MEKTLQYLNVLESLKLQEGGENVQSNLACLQKFIKRNNDNENGGESTNEHKTEENKNCALIAEIYRQNLKTLNSENIEFIEDFNDNEKCYVTLMQHVLLTIKENTNFNSEAKEDLISTKHLNLCIEALQEISIYALKHQLHPSFYGNRIFDDLPTSRKNNPNQFSATMLWLSVEFFDRILSVKQFHIRNSMELVIRDYMAAIFTLQLINGTKGITINEKLLQHKLDTIWLKMTKLEYFRNLMLFKSFADLPIALQNKLHQELTQKVASKDGFTSLVAVLQTATTQNVETGRQHTYELIANIVAFRGHTQRFQSVMIKQIFTFINLCIRNEAMMENMGAGLLALRRLYDLNIENRELIAKYVNDSMMKLTQPEDVISGLIVMEHMEFCQLVTLLYQLFYTSSVECLPSEMLIRYLPMLLKLYYNLPDGLVQKQQLADIASRCLNNRDMNELQKIIEKLYTRHFDHDWQELHERIIIFPITTPQLGICFKIASQEYKSECSLSLSLPMLLMQANHSILTYNVFIALLQLMAANVLEPDKSELDIGLVQNEEELITLLNAKYPVKIEIILSLNTLISSQSLKSQIEQNSKEFLKLMRQLVEQRINHQIPINNTESSDQILLIMLTLTQELLEHTHIPEEHRDLVPFLVRLRKESPNMLVQQRSTTLISILNGNATLNATIQDEEFSMARTLLESHESHLQVYGIQKLLNLLRQHDPYTMANGHIIIALALTTLKQKESYTFLNCVRLFVELVNVMEAEVLEILSDEYLNENSNIDFRLVVGEAILKVSQELGPLCYKYKDVLLNMFMHGARSTLDEFRMSSFANLAQLCRILSYQVLNFFQELLHLIDCELSTGKYLPSKRAALLVLSDLLEGINNLMDFEELLLPVYRLLKFIATTETNDDQLRTHATNGLKALSEKCKKFIFPEEVLRKEIRIVGIKDDDKSRSKKKHILEIN